MNDTRDAATLDAGRAKYVTIARMSWVYPVIAIVMSQLTGRIHGIPREVTLILAAIQLLLMLLGGVLSIVALTSVKRYGKEQIRGPAIAGLVIFICLALLMALIVPAILKALALARQHQ